MQLNDSNEYRATKEWPYAISAGCIVFRKIDTKVEVLLLVRDSSKIEWGRSQNQKLSYHLPKGHCGFNETLAQAAVRETQEEAAVEGEVQTYLGARTDIFVHPNTQYPTDKTVHYFALLWKNDLPGMDSEHSSKTWVSIEEAEKLLGKPNPKGEDELIRRFKKYLEVAR